MLPLKGSLIFILSLQLKFYSCDDFPSLLTANASIAIVLDREYLEVDGAYESILKEMKIIVERVLREDLKNGGLIVNYYSWTKINFKKDFSAVFSVTNCGNTWDIFKDARAEVWWWSLWNIQSTLHNLFSSTCFWLQSQIQIVLGCRMMKP